MRHPLIIGNWKMNLTLEEACALARRVRVGLREIPGHVDVVLAPPMSWLLPVEAILGRSQRLTLGAQDASVGLYGNETGNVSLGMLKEHIDYVLIGHSERRLASLDTHKTINAKLRDALSRDITPVLFVGEFTKLYDQRRKRGRPTKLEAASNIFMQLRRALKDVKREQLSKIVLVYEPVWAISTGSDAGGRSGQAADPEYVRVMVQTLRRALARQGSRRIAANTRILYGGSVSASNAAQFAAIPELDGAVPGTASRDVDQFLGIVEAFARRNS